MAPAQVRTRTLRGTLTKTGLTLAVTLGLALALAGGHPRTTQPVPSLPGGTTHPQTIQALIGGCGPIYTFTDPDHTSGTTTNPRRYHWPTTVPAYGPMAPTGAPSSQVFWTPDEPGIPSMPTLLRDQYDGWLTAYYTPAVNPTDLNNLQMLASTHPELRMRVVPWPTRRGPLPNNRAIAFATWEASQTCARLNAAALREYRDAHPATQAPGATGTLPPTLDR